MYLIFRSRFSTLRLHQLDGHGFRAASATVFLSHRRVVREHGKVMPWYCEHSDLGATVYLIGGGDTMISLQGLPQIVAAIGGLGTAAFGLVDASKAAWGGVNHIDFSQIQETVKSLTPGTPNNALSQDKIVATLKANWFAGTALASQK
jgi:hypothetical protein